VIYVFFGTAGLRWPFGVLGSGIREVMVKAAEKHSAASVVAFVYVVA